jgi:tight adherence protein B
MHALASVLVAVAVTLAIPAVLQAWDSLAARYILGLKVRMEAVGLDPRLLLFYMRGWGACLVAVVLCAVALNVIIIAIPVAYCIYRLPTLIIDRLIARRRTLLRDQMAVASIGLANAVRAGLSLPQGLEGVVRETPDPLKHELHRIVTHYHRGRPLPEAIEEARGRLELDGFTLFAHAVNTCLQRGGNISSALENISRSLAENQRIERKLDADTAAGRMTVVILSLVPVGFLGAFFVFDPPRTMLLFTTLAGQGIMCVVVGVVYASARMAAKILAIDV